MNVILIRFHDIDVEFTVIGFFRKAGFNCIINITSLSDCFLYLNINIRCAVSVGRIQPLNVG